MSKRKGITPVIAVILLLGITVAAVGLLYPQIQNMISNTNTDVNNKQLSFSSTYNNSGNLSIVVENSGDAAWNTSEFELSFVPPGSSSPVGLTAATSGNLKQAPGLTGNQCFVDDSDSAQLVNPGGSYECKTGLMFPLPTQSVELVVQDRNSEQVMARATCAPKQSGAVGC